MISEDYEESLTERIFLKFPITILMLPIINYVIYSTWDYKEINEQRLKIISSTRQTKISRYVSLIID